MINININSFLCQNSYFRLLEYPLVTVAFILFDIIPTNIDPFLHIIMLIASSVMEIKFIMFISLIKAMSGVMIRQGSLLNERITNSF